MLRMTGRLIGISLLLNEDELSGAYRHGPRGHGTSFWADRPSDVVHHLPGRQNLPSAHGLRPDRTVRTRDQGFIVRRLSERPSPEGQGGSCSDWARNEFRRDVRTRALAGRFSDRRGSFPVPTERILQIPGCVSRQFCERASAINRGLLLAKPPKRPISRARFERLPPERR